MSSSLVGGEIYTKMFFNFTDDPQNQYRSDLNWMKGVGWETEGCLNIAQAKKAGELLSDVSEDVRLCMFLLHLADFKSTVLFLSDQISSEGRQHQLHPGGGRSLHQTRQKKPGTAERREIPTLMLLSCSSNHTALCFHSTACLLLFSAGVQSKHRADNSPVHHH